MLEGRAGNRARGRKGESQRCGWLSECGAETLTRYSLGPVLVLPRTPRVYRLVVSVVHI